MKINKKTLKQAVDANIITEPQAQRLYDFLSNQSYPPSLTLTNVLYYLGGLIAIGAMTLFINLSWQTFGGFGIFGLALVYTLLGLAFTNHFNKTHHSIPAGICATFVICLTPLAIYGFQVGMGWWPGQSAYRDNHTLIHWRWLCMELGTLCSGLILVWIYRYPFMLMPISVTLWYLSMDLTSMLTQGALDFQLSITVSFYFGLLLLGLAFLVDLRSRFILDYAFWLYLCGVIIFWGGLSDYLTGNELAKGVYCLINLGLILIGVALSRRVFIIFGGIGVMLYFVQLANGLFKDTILFPMILSMLGLGILYLGVIWQRCEARLTHKLRSYLPIGMQQLLEARENDA